MGNMSFPGKNALFCEEPFHPSRLKVSMKREFTKKLVFRLPISVNNALMVCSPHGAGSGWTGSTYSVRL